MSRRQGTWGAAIVVALGLTGCANDPEPVASVDPVNEIDAAGEVDAADDTLATDPPATVAASTAPSSTALTTPSIGPETTGVSEPNGPVEVDGLRGRRYCEVLLIRPGADAVMAEVYNSYGLNDCPAAQWEQLDAAVLAAEQDAPVALLNGPRYWLMDRIGRTAGRAPTTVDFGGIDMFLAATVEITPGAAAAPYIPSAVDRATVFTFDAGSRLYELVTADGEVFVMQSWSQQVDPALDEAGLADLGSRLDLPEGWTFLTRITDQPLRVETLDSPAQVLQDELRNSYSLQVVS
jgi:hypothetical protein